MPAAPVFRRRPARFGLVLAALLHLFGAAGGVWVHAHPVRTGSEVAVTGEESERGSAPAHNELTCTICQHFGAHAIPGAAVVLHGPTETSTRAATPGEALHALVFPLTARPRAPPLA